MPFNRERKEHAYAYHRERRLHAGVVEHRASRIWGRSTVTKRPDDETKERQLALAKLFAAAPRLLEVCKLVLKRLDLEASEREARGQDNIFPCAALRNDLRAAIAEAEGRGA